MSKINKYNVAEKLILQESEVGGTTLLVMVVLNATISRGTHAKTKGRSTIQTEKNKLTLSYTIFRKIIKQ